MPAVMRDQQHSHYSTCAQAACKIDAKQQAHEERLTTPYVTVPVVVLTAAAGAYAGLCACEFWIVALTARATRTMYLILIAAMSAKTPNKYLWQRVIFLVPLMAWRCDLTFYWGDASANQRWGSVMIDRWLCFGIWAKGPFKGLYSELDICRVIADQCVDALSFYDWQI